MCLFVLCSISCNINAKLFTLRLIYSEFANLQYIQFSSKDSIPYFCSLSLHIVYLSNHYISIIMLLLLRLSRFANRIVQVSVVGTTVVILMCFYSAKVTSKQYTVS